MENNYFKIKYAGKEIDLTIDSGELKLCQADEFENKISLFIDIQAKSIEIDFFDEEDQETYQHYIETRIHTEWLEIPID
ncbi:MAG TPA: hypothetical protein VJ304_09495 [Flavobacterium sp.]|nr:hypothetical protein [Flavobacterium sp.]